MRIGIIGAGSMAQAICKHALKADHTVMLSNSRGLDSLSYLADKLGCYIGSREEAIEFADIVIIAIPLGVYQTLPQQALSGKVVLELLNYFPHRDGKIPELDNEEITTSELLAKHLPEARLVKAFNSITAEDLVSDARAAGSSERRAIPIASNDSEAKEIAKNFINQLGFDVADGGKLADSWRFERFRPAYCVAATAKALEKTLRLTDRDSKVPDGYWLTHREALA